MGADLVRARRNGSGRARAYFDPPKLQPPVRGVTL
jgi:hypothetical protein